VRCLKAIALLPCVIILSACSISCSAQDDSLLHKLSQLASRKRFTQFIYRAIFVEPRSGDYTLKPPAAEGVMLNPHLAYEGRVIRKINLVVSDPFGYAIDDTLAGPATFLQKTGNALHITTRKWILNNKLLFKPGDSLNPTRVSESERLLRQSAFANDVRIRVIPVDSVYADVEVRMTDKWSVIAPIELTDAKASVSLRDNNFFGLGHRFNQFARIDRDGDYQLSGTYTLDNIDNTYISSSVAYETSNTGTTLGLAFDRRFFSPLARWAGGAALAHRQQKFEYTEGDGSTATLNTLQAGWDVWGGRAFKLLADGRRLRESHNFITALRYAGTHFTRLPPAAETLPGNENVTSVLGSLGFVLQQYYKERFIYRFGATEDVPAGLIVNLACGVQKRQHSALRYYSGLEIARALHLPLGYFSASLAAGIFFSPYYTNDITSRAELGYFSNLVKLDGWYLRQFANITLVRGYNRLYGEQLSLTGQDLYGFEGGSLYGNMKMVARLETVAYAPYNLVGFHVAPVLMCGYGVIGGANQSLHKNRLYQAYSMGILFRNENLLNSTFQVSFGLYPYFPDGGRYVWKYNPVTSFTIRVRVFEVGRPEFIGY
jgi:hypothetical protein